MQDRPGARAKTPAPVVARPRLLQLAAEDDHPTHFFDVLLTALKKVDPVLVKDAAVLASRSGQEGMVEALVISLVRALAAHPREMVIILDDAHHLWRAGVLKGLQLLLEYAPQNLQCALATRSVPGGGTVGWVQDAWTPPGDGP